MTGINQNINQPLPPTPPGIVQPPEQPDQSEFYRINNLGEEQSRQINQGTVNSGQPTTSQPK